VIGLAAVVVIAVVWMLASDRSMKREAGPPPAGADDRSIAVLPFADMSPDQNQEYLSDGISVELGDLLTKIPQLRVTAQFSSLTLKGQNLGIQEIARRLNVAYILAGSVRKAEGQVRINVQLIDAQLDTLMWSETWDRSLDDIFEIQDEIAAEVVAQLKVTLLGAAPKVEATDPEAYALFLQARQLNRQLTGEALERSNVLYQQALDIDPDYAGAWVGLADNYGVQALLGLRPQDEALQLAREPVNRALAIDPEYAPAHAGLGMIAMLYDDDPAAAAQHYERALELEPTNPDIIHHAAYLARRLGRVDEAVPAYEYVVARDPVNVESRAGLGLSYIIAGRLDEAVASLRTLVTLSPDVPWVHFGFGVALYWNGEPEAALAAMHQESSPVRRLIGLALVYHALGQAVESDAALAELIEKYEQRDAYHIASVLAFRGEADRAFEWLDKAVEQSDPGLGAIAVTKLFANIHDDPRWLPFLESIGKSPEQLAAIEFKVRLPH